MYVLPPWRAMLKLKMDNWDSIFYCLNLPIAVLKIKTPDSTVILPAMNMETADMKVSAFWQKCLSVKEVEEKKCMEWLYNPSVVDADA